jgi:NitT/TauT family transport system permease protein
MGIEAIGRRLAAGRALPLTLVLLVILAFWYAGAVWLNAPRVREQLESEGIAPGTRELVRATWAMERPVLPAPHQVGAELYASVLQRNPTSKRSLVYHAWSTTSATLTGFALGALLGVLLAVGIVHLRTLDRSLLPWIVASQTVPILAIAPMIVVALGSVGLTGLLPKAVISMYLCFFPVTAGMVKGLRSPEPLHLDLMRTYSASASQALWKLRLPASLPFLFASLKVAIAASLVGAIVGELPTGAQEGIGARLLSGSYYGQTVQIWAALAMASFLGLALVGIVGRVEDRIVRSRGGRR